MFVHLRSLSKERERERVGFGPLGYEAQVRIRVRDLAILKKNRVRVWRSAAIKKLSKIFLFIFSIYCKAFFYIYNGKHIPI